MGRTSLVQLVEGLRRYGEETAVVERRGYRTERWSYRRLAETACRVARELEARGVAPGDRVLLQGANSAEWMAAFHGTLLRGGVAVPLDEGSTPDFVARVAQSSGARLGWVARGAAPEGVPAIALEEMEATVGGRSPGPYAAPALTRTDPAEIVFTSGTTSEPKGVVLSHGNLLANLEPLEAEIAKYRRWERLVHPLRFLELVPLSHVFGQFMGLLVPQALAATAVFSDTLNPTEVIRTIRREGVSVLVTVPRLAESLQDKLERDWEDAGRLGEMQKRIAAAEGIHFLRRWWRFRSEHRRFGWKFWAIVSGGAALPAETEDFWRRLGYAVVQGYGMTETASLVSVNHPFRTGRGSIGKTLPGTEVRLDASGEILVRGASVAAGYWQGQQLVPMEGDEGWLRTGDLGEYDAEGNLRFKGRRKSVLVTPEGLNVYPEDLEAALRAEPEVRDCAVVGVERGGNAEACAVLLLKNAIANAEAVVARANRRLAGHQQVRSWMVWPEADFPRTATGKPRAHILAEAARAQLGREKKAPAASPLGELVARVTGRRTAGLAAGARLEADLKLSSIERVELASALEDRYQVGLEDADLTGETTLAELESLVRERAAPAKGEARAYPRWAMRWPLTWIRLAVYYLLTWPATLLLGYPRIRGRERLRDVRGPMLVVSNHIASIDIGFVLAALPFRLRNRLATAMEGELLWAMRNPPASMNPLRRAYERMCYALVVALFNVFPLPQRSGFRQSFAYAGECVDRGYSVLVFPEGARTKDGRMAEFLRGTGMLASGLGVPVVPMRIDGLFELKQAKKWATRPGRVKVTIGEPVRFPRGADADEVTRELGRRVAAL